MGYFVIFEDANETFDPILEPILMKQLKKEGNEWMIKFGDKVLTYSLDFKFYITTKIARPHYSPETCVKVTMINFMVTPDGLLDQITSVILKIEEGKKYEAREKCITDKAKNDKMIKELQDKILASIAESSDDILEDKELKSSLEESQKSMAEIEQSMVTMEKTMKGIDAFRAEVRHISNRVSRLFFVLTELINVNDMYQYSLDFFKDIFERVLNDAKKTDEVATMTKKEKHAWFIDEFQRRMFKQVSWSLFENHKLLFAFLITIKNIDERILETDKNGINTAELRFMMAGSTKVQASQANPSGADGWLSEKNWCAIEEMTDLFPKSFPNFDKSFAKDVKLWEKLYDSANPHEHEMPGEWKKLELIQKTMIMRILRPDKVTQMIQNLVRTEMGEYYVKPAPFDIMELYNNSVNKAPIIMVISPGADPMSEIQKFSVLKKIAVDSLSLGKGQDKKATE